MIPPLPPGDAVLGIGTLNRLVRDCLETAFPLMWVGGEISNLTYAASGHVYFSLKDAGAQVRCVMWRSRAQLLGWRLENGQKVEARALVSFYEPRGEFQLNIEAVRRAGQGDLFERFLRLKAQLESEGLFAAERKRPLPAFPRHVAIVTSPQAAALRDVLTTLRRRAPHLRLTLCPTPVQGDGAGERIAAALVAAGTLDCDAIILCRGGGSIEDLWAFNEEAVARAIAVSPVPIVSGVGHETDFTIADFAADLRAPTPTAAAEQISPDRDSLLTSIDDRHRRLRRAAERGDNDRRQRLDRAAARLVHPAQRLQRQRQAIAALGARLARAVRQQADRRQLQLGSLAQQLPGPRTAERRERLSHLHYRLQTQVHSQISQQAGKLTSLARGLRQLDPLAVLGRGYALAIGPDGRAVRDSATLKSGDTLTLQFAHGKASSTVDQVVADSDAE